MDAIILDEIPFQPDLQKLTRKLRLKEGSRYIGKVERLVAEAQAIAKPRALYGVAYIDARSESRVVVDDIVFDSRVLQVNLEKAQRVFPFLATCGIELQMWVDAQQDILERFFAETISEMALRQALGFFKDHLDERFRLGRTSTMSPGSLADWPIQAQRPLFALLGDTQETLGVRLTDRLLMVPTKSVSGIRFPTEHTFASCQLCPRENCPTRQAPHNAALYDQRYRVVRDQGFPLPGDN